VLSRMLTLSYMETMVRVGVPGREIRLGLGLSLASPAKELTLSYMSVSGQGWGWGWGWGWASPAGRMLTLSYMKGV
jgi:hypothetical protein